MGERIYNESGSKNRIRMGCMSIKKKNVMWALLCPLVYLVVLWRIVPMVYGIVDDRTMMEIVSGQYLGRSDAHMIFTGWWYPLLLSGLYRLVPYVDWYAFGFLVIQSGCMSLMFYRLLGQEKGWQKRLFLCLELLLWAMVLGMQALTQITFTTTAAVLAVTVVFWYLTTEIFSLRNLAVLFVLCVLTVELRFAVFCMLMPVCGILWLFRIWEGKEKIPGHRWVPVAAASALLLYVLGLVIGYGSGPWRSYYEQNNTRSWIYDYDDYMFPRIEEEPELYESLGIRTKSRAKNLYYYNYTADDQITSDFFATYYEARRAQVRVRTDRSARLKESVKAYLVNVFQGKYRSRHLLALLGYGALMLWYAFLRKWKRFLKVCCVPGVQLVLWIYLIYRGRVPERVVITMNLMLIVPLLLLWREALSQRRRTAAYGKAAACFLAALLCAAAVRETAAVRSANLETWKGNQNVEGLKEYCMEHPENFYFNDVTSMAMSTWNVRLWRSEPYVMNYMSLGDWIGFSPLWEEKLKQQGIASVREALYEQENVYLICSFDRGLEYLTSLYEGVSCEEIDSIRGFHICRLQSL